LHSKETGKKSDLESDMMMIQSIELSKNTANENAYNNLPRYRSAANSESEVPASATRAGFKGGKAMTNSGVTAHSPRGGFGIDSTGLSKQPVKSLHLGKQDSASKKEKLPAWGSGPGSKDGANSALQPRQTRNQNSVKRPGTAKTNSG